MSQSRTRRTNVDAPIEVAKWAGLEEVDPVIGNHWRASYYNDTAKKTFKEISELIKTNISEEE